MPVGGLGAIEEDPVALVRGASLQPRKSVRPRQTDHLPQHPAQSTRAGDRSEFDHSLVGDRQHERELPTCRSELASFLVGLRTMLRRIQKEIAQGSPQFQRSPVIRGTDMCSPPHQAALAHPRIQHARRRDLVSSGVRDPVFYVAALVESVHEIVEQREVGRYGVFLGKLHRHQHIAFAS